MKIAYITAYTPFGRGETFVLDEMLALVEYGVNLTVVPRSPGREIFHQKAERLLPCTLRLPLLNWRILLSFFKALIFKPKLWWIFAKIFRNSRNFKIALKNLAVTPKAVFIAYLFQKEGVEHIHAHWGSTTATMAWIVSELTGIPWSVTLHRWDIAEDNMLQFKVKQASFVRCISEDGRRTVLDIAGETYRDKVIVLHMGVRLPEKVFAREPFCLRSHFVIACPANLVPVKGHRFLIEACALLRNRGVDKIQCLLIGDGPLEEEIRQQIKQHKLEDVIKLVGRLPHEEMLRMYEKGEVDAVVLPSIVTHEGEKEGIPVALMEAMAYGIPVISTNTGGIPELLAGGAGILVEEKDAEKLANAIELLLTNPELAKEVGVKGQKRVQESFNLSKNTEELIELFKENASRRAL